MPHVKRNTGIYCIENKINGKKYVGQAYNVERRVYEHWYHLARGTDHSGVLQRAVNKYGLDNFCHYVLENCEPEQMNEREIYWIDKLQTNNKECGYNLSRGGEKSLLGHKFPPEFGRKISEMKKGTKITDEHKRKISEFHKGRPKSAETRKKMSENHARYMLGKKHLPETIEKLRIAHGGQNAYQFGKKTPNATSSFFGVCKQTQRGHTYYKASIKVCGVRTYLGASKNELEAARMYDAYVIEHNLPNPLNFPEER